MKIITLTSLLFMMIPLLIVGSFYWRWLGKKNEIAVASLRMLSQLLMIGYILNWLFNQNSPAFAVVILLFMITASSLIAQRNHPIKTRRNLLRTFIAITIGGTLNLTLVILVILQPDPAYKLSVLIPLAGMIYSNGMNTVSLAGERFWKQIENGSCYEDARNEAFRSSLIPQTNSFLAVGLVALPGMMTGQVLSGVDPLIAVRYQIMVMSMILGTAGISMVSYLILCKSDAIPAGHSDTDCNHSHPQG